MYATLKLKKRYIVFQIKSPTNISENDVKTGLFSFLLKFFGEYGYSELSYKFLQYQCDQRGSTARKQDMPHSVTTSQIVTAASCGILNSQFVNEEKIGFGLIQCERGALNKLLGALALVENLNGKKARTVVVGVSGTIKTLREKGFTFIYNSAV